MVSAGPDYSGLIAGVIVGGVAAIVLAAALLYTVRWSSQSYRFRSYKRLIEDHVHTLVLGLRSEHLLPYNSRKKSFNSDDIDVEDGARVSHCSLIHLCCTAAEEYAWPGF